MAPRYQRWLRGSLFAASVAMGLMTSGCALVVSAHVNHNSRGSACIKTPAFAVVDIGITAGLALALAESREEGDSPFVFVLPALFAASGVLGLVESFRCQQKSGGREVRRQRRPTNSKTPPPPLPTSESLSSPRNPDKRVPLKPDPLRLPDNYDLPDPNDRPGACGPRTYFRCPSGQTCVTKGSSEGTCQPVDSPPQEAPESSEPEVPER